MTGRPVAPEPAERRLQLGEKTFAVADQQAFAELSGDVNPLHMDPLLARRLLIGRPVVHGVNLLLHALELWLNHHRQRPAEIDCSFLHAVSVGERATFAEVKRTGPEHTIEVGANDLVCVRIVLRTARSSGPVRSSDGAAAGEVGYERVQAASPLEIEPAAQRGRKYEIALRGASGRETFPLVDALPARGVAAAFAALSYFVGMVCPGMHSVFSSISVRFGDESDDRDALRFSVDRFDERFGLFIVSVSGLLSGEIRAFVRPPPARQHALEDLASHIGRGEFSGTTSLVIGGSRGLGELTAKLLASGGGSTIVTYATGAGDARAVRDEINRSGLATCEVAAFDLRHDSFDALPVDPDRLQMVYFFATPRIYRKKPVVFDGALFEEFTRFYVTRFHELCAWLESRAARPVRVFFPSSVYIDSRPREFAEYAMAKAAAEVLIADLNRVFKKVSIVCVRLPRLNTDQTATLLGVATESNVDALVPIVRRMAAPDTGRAAGH